MKKIFFFFLVVFLVVLAGCGKQCEKDADCAAKDGMVASCDSGDCSYAEFKPDICGNKLCETGENKCSCYKDCGICTGKEGTYMSKTCVNVSATEQECLSDVTSAKPVVMTKELPSGGDKFKITVNFKQPFNTKKDKFLVETAISAPSQYNTNIRIKNIELTGVTKDRRTITLGSASVDKSLWPNSKTSDGIVLDFAAEKEGELTSFSLKISYDYTAIVSGKPASKSAILQTTYSQKFIYVNPDFTYPCPMSCDDNNPGTDDLCGPETNYFCKNTPVSGQCGNFVCEAQENKCSCVIDCGSCSGAAGAYTSYSCVGADCKVSLNSGATIAPVSLFDDRKIGIINLQNNYKYNNPFNTKTDKFTLEFTLVSTQTGVSDVKITAVRLLEGSNEIASTTTSTALTAGQKAVVELSVPAQSLPEVEKSLNLAIWYDYTQSGSVRQASFQKTLGKIVLINAD